MIIRRMRIRGRQYCMSSHNRQDCHALAAFREDVAQNLALTPLLKPTMHHFVVGEVLGKHMSLDPGI